MARIAQAPQRRTNLTLWALVLLGVGLLSILPLTLLNSGSDDASTAVAAPSASKTRIAYFEFERTADTLWLADPTKPDSRTKGLTINHAPEYGVVPTLSPDGRSVAYLVLPPETPAPGPDAPAQLWAASIVGNAPKLIASDVDLLVPAVWTPDGSGLIYRRSDDFSHLLLSYIDGRNPERGLMVSRDPLFPVGFSGSSPDSGPILQWIEMNEYGSALRWLGLNGNGDLTAQLSIGLTRDWTISPDGTRIAYLEMTLDGQQATSRAFVIDLATGEKTAVGSSDSNAFSPAWTPDGKLVLGQLVDGIARNPATVIGDGTTSSLAAPRRGFDVPLAVDAEAGTAVTSFDGTSLNNPGRASLVVVKPDGSRQEIASGEVTFLGWISP